MVSLNKDTEVLSLEEAKEESVAETGIMAVVGGGAPALKTTINKLFHICPICGNAICTCSLRKLLNGDMDNVGL